MKDLASPNMATSTAPYYQPARNLSYPHGHNGANSYQPQAEDYELAASAAPHAPMYAGIANGGTELANGSHGQQQHQYQHQHFGQTVTSDEQALNSTPELAGLLQAVTSAVGQEQEQEQDHNGMQGHVIAGDDVFAQTMGGARREGQTGRDTTFANGRGIPRTHQGKRKRGYLAEQVDAEHFDELPGASQQISNAYPQSKRRRRAAYGSDTVPAGMSTTIPMSGVSNGTSSGTMNGQDVNFPIHDSNPPALSDARAAGVHSAAALFRQTTNSSRKYTRPPMSQLFYSLQLNAESFLHLQAAAKNYMLDPTHPERQNCVGNRGKGDNDMVKLRLFNCVRDFLTDGIGEKFFGEKASGRVTYSKDGLETPIESTGYGEKCFIWPRDGNKIVSLVTPLMRRMVTNERQRMYAIETRKGGSSNSSGATSTKKRDSTTTTSPTRLRSASMVQDLGDESTPQFLQSAALDAIAHDTGQTTGLRDGGHQKLQAPETETFPPQSSNALDPALSSMTDTAAVIPVAMSTTAATGPTHQQQAVAAVPPPLARIFIIRNNVKVIPTFEIAFSESHPLSFADLEGNILKHIRSHRVELPSSATPIATAKEIDSIAREAEDTGNKILEEEAEREDETIANEKKNQNGKNVEAERLNKNNSKNNNTKRANRHSKALDSTNPDADPDIVKEQATLATTRTRTVISSLEPEPEPPRPKEPRSSQPSLSSLSSSSSSSSSSFSCKITAYTSKGVSHISNDEEWSRAREDALTTVHMDDVVKVVVELL